MKNWFNLATKAVSALERIADALECIAAWPQNERLAVSAEVEVFDRYGELVDPQDWGRGK